MEKLKHNEAINAITGRLKTVYGLRIIFLNTENAATNNNAKQYNQKAKTD